MRHTLTTRRVLVRGDGSTSHEGLFDLETGEFLQQTTHQGYRGDSCWTRGLAWSLYGFGTCYGYTRDPRFLADRRGLRRFLPRQHATPTAWRPGTSTPRRKAANCSTPPPPPSPPPACFQLAKLLRRPHQGPASTTSAARRILATLCEQTPGQGRSQLGRHPQGRRLPPAQGPGRERVRDVGRVLLPGSAGKSAGVISAWIRRSTARPGNPG